MVRAPEFQHFLRPSFPSLEQFPSPVYTVTQVSDCESLRRALGALLQRTLVLVCYRVLLGLGLSLRHFLGLETGSESATLRWSSTLSGGVLVCIHEAGPWLAPSSSLAPGNASPLVASLWGLHTSSPAPPFDHLQSLPTAVSTPACPAPGG